MRISNLKARRELFGKLRDGEASEKSGKGEKG